MNTIYYQTNEAYDPITNTWSSYSNLPISRFAGAAVESLGEIHYFGGGLYQNNTLSQVYNTHYIFNPTSNLWTTGTQMLSSRFKQVSAIVDNKIYIIGGGAHCFSFGMYFFGMDILNVTNANDFFFEPCPDITSKPVESIQADLEFKCTSCNESFVSRNKLFKHIVIHKNL